MQEIRLRWLLLGALCSSIGMSFIWPLTTIYLHNRLGASLTVVGVILLLYSSANVVGSVLGGRLFDRFNPYYLTIGGVTLSLITLGGTNAESWLAGLSHRPDFLRVSFRLDAHDGQLAGYHDS